MSTCNGTYLGDYSVSPVVNETNKGSLNFERTSSKPVQTHALLKITDRSVSVGVWTTFVLKVLQGGSAVSTLGNLINNTHAGAKKAIIYCTRDVIAAGGTSSSYT